VGEVVGLGDGATKRLSEKNKSPVSNFHYKHLKGHEQLGFGENSTEERTG
jgi:hypothetical protein